jgi:hypothetical protein
MQASGPETRGSDMPKHHDFDEERRPGRRGPRHGPRWDEEDEGIFLDREILAELADPEDVPAIVRRIRRAPPEWEAMAALVQGLTQRLIAIETSVKRIEEGIEGGPRDTQ